jgi:hypothetical protein
MIPQDANQQVKRDNHLRIKVFLLILSIEKIASLIARKKQMLRLDLAPELELDKASEVTWVYTCLFSAPMNLVKARLITFRLIE